MLRDVIRVSATVSAQICDTLGQLAGLLPAALGALGALGVGRWGSRLVLSENSSLVLVSFLFWRSTEQCCCRLVLLEASDLVPDSLLVLTLSLIVLQKRQSTFSFLEISLKFSSNCGAADCPILCRLSLSEKHQDAFFGVFWQGRRR